MALLDSTTAATGAVTDLTVSVVIPAYNDELRIQTTLECLLAQGRTPDEIIVVDNDSTDTTRDVVLEYAKANGSVIRLLRETKRSSYAARNKGIAQATGTIVCFIDAGMTAPPHYLERVREQFRSDQMNFLAFPVDLPINRRTLAAVYNAAMGFPMASYAKAGYVGAGCMCIRRAVIDRLGTFDERLESGGDREFGQRLSSSGYYPTLDDAVHLAHPARETFASLTSKARRVGRGLAQLEAYFPERYGNTFRRRNWVRTIAPIRPATFRARLRDRGIEAAWWEVFLLIWYRPILNFFQIAGLNGERRRLGVQ